MLRYPLYNVMINSNHLCGIAVITVKLERQHIYLYKPASIRYRFIICINTVIQIYYLIYPQSFEHDIYADYSVLL